MDGGELFIRPQFLDDLATDSCSSASPDADAGNIPATSQRKRSAETLPFSFTDRTTRLVISTDESTITLMTRFRASCSSSGFLGTAVTSCARFGVRDFDLLFFAFAVRPPQIEKGRDLRRALQSFSFFRLLSLGYQIGGGCTANFSIFIFAFV